MLTVWKGAYVHLSEDSHHSDESSGNHPRIPRRYIFIKDTDNARC
jgi:hypothetical protein